MLKKDYDANLLKGPLPSHSTRKTFAKALWELSNKDIIKVQQILGHKNAPVNIMIVAIVDDIELQQ
jgi:integrase